MSFQNLRINENVFIDNSIVNYEYYTYQPYSSTTYNNCDEIHIPINTSNVCTLPSQSYLYIEGKLLKEDGKTLSQTLKFINNGLAFLFDEIRYLIGSTVVDRVRNVGITSTLKSLVSFTSNQCTRLENAGWDIKVHPNLLKDGYFNACIPLYMLLGFMEDFKKIIVNINQELVLIRSNTDLNAVVNVPDTATDKPKVLIDKILWKVPHIRVSDVEKLKLIDINRDLSLEFRSWELQELPMVHKTDKHTWNVKTTSNMEKPRFIIFALQTNRRNEVNREACLFDHCKLRNIKVYLNSEVYPYGDLQLDFRKKQCSILYEMFAQFQKSYYYKNEADPCLSYNDFIARTPIVLVDCSRQSETIKNGAVDIRLEFETSDVVPDKTAAYCLISHDRLVFYNPLSSSVKIL